MAKKTEVTKERHWVRAGHGRKELERAWEGKRVEGVRANTIPT